MSSAADDGSAVDRLSDLLGATVVTSDGTTIGRLVDIAVAFDGGAPDVERLIVATDRTHRSAVAAASVRRFEPRRIVIDPPDQPAADDLHLEPRELLLVRDVLDTQIFDITGGRLAHVGDIHLRIDPDAHATVLAVDTSFASVCRRLGLARLAARISDEVVGWSDLHLTSSRGHAVQLQTTKAAIHRLTPAQLAVLLGRVSTSHGAEIATALAPEVTAAALAAAPTELGHRILDAIGDPEAEALIDALPHPHHRRYRVARQDRERPRRWLRRHRPRSTEPVGPIAPVDGPGAPEA